MSGLSAKTRDRLLYLISPIGLLLLWQVLLMMGIGDRRFIPAPSDIAVRFVQLARALAVEPRMLLMDEPFAALDAQTRDVLQAELQEIWQRTGSTILFITHNVREAALLGDRVIVMTPSPGRFKSEIPVPLKRPRDPDTHAVVDFAAEIRTQLQHDEYPVRAKDSGYVI